MTFSIISKLLLIYNIITACATDKQLRQLKCWLKM